MEGAENLRYGISLGLDPLSLTRDIGGKLLILINGNGDVLMDDTIFVKDYLDMTHVAFKGSSSTTSRTRRTSKRFIFGR